MLKLLNSVKCLLINDSKICKLQAGALLHTSAVLNANWNKRNGGPRNFLSSNKKIYEPQLPGEKPRPAVTLRLVT